MIGQSFEVVYYIRHKSLLMTERNKEGKSLLKKVQSLTYV